MADINSNISTEKNKWEQIKHFSQKTQVVIFDLKKIQLYTGDTFQTQRYEQIKSKRMRKYIS